jgi:uncharacterized protein
VWPDQPVDGCRKSASTENSGAEPAGKKGILQMPYADISFDPFSLLGALYRAGLARANGDEGDIDLVDAHKWFNLAAAKGHEDAKFQRAEMAEMLSTDEIKLALQAARDWMKLSH